MSRIEQALEKAAKMRGASAAKGRVFPNPIGSDKCDPAVFEVPENRIDTAAIDQHIISVTDPCCGAAEEYKKLRARIFSSTEKDFLNSILVTSSLAGEGKTITAINLAVTMAQEIDHTVLLIDADLRQPSIHTYLGITPQYGLSEYLQSKAELSEVLIKTGIGKLVLLPAGNPPSNPSELLASEKMRDLVREMKYRYRDRYIIFDSSPLLSTADGLYLKEYIDGVVFVVQAARTPMKTADQALSLLKGTRVFGTVFNNVPEYVSTRDASYYYRTRTPGQNGMRGVDGPMEWAGAFPGSVSALFHRDRLQAIGKKIKINIRGLLK